MIPDIYVGYMVPGVVRPVPYRVTHFAKPEHIPKPRAGEFFDAYVLCSLARECGLLDALGDDCATGRCQGARFASVASGFVGADSDPCARWSTTALRRPRACPERSWRAPASLAAEVVHVSPAHTPTFEWDFDVAETAACQRDAFATSRRALSRDELRRSLFDMVLGTWVHLLADCTWNQAVSDLLDARGEQPSRDFRIKKQGDFDLFGKSLELRSPCRVSRHSSSRSRRRFLSTRSMRRRYLRPAPLPMRPCAPITRSPGAVYRLLDEEFFSRVFAEVNARAEREMEYAGTR
ncbi:MAG: hypothetical protein ACLTSX_05950 [Collinsella sp.]